MKKVITIISCCIIIFSIGGCMNREKYMSDWFTSEQEEAHHTSLRNWKLERNIH